MASQGYALGAGAGAGLEQVLSQMMEQAKFEQLKKQQDSQQAEMVRSHTAGEAIDRERITAMERERLSRDSITERNNKDISDRAARDDGRALAEEIPGGTPLAAGDDVSLNHGGQDPAVGLINKAGGGSLLKMRQASPAVPESLVAPGDTGEAQPKSFIKLKTAAQTEKGLADTRAVDAARATADYRKAVLAKPPAPDRVLIQTPEGYVRRSDATATLAGGGTVAGPESAVTKNRRDMADAVGSHFDDVNHLLDEADQKGLLGPLKGRTFVEFMSGKVGSTGNAANDELLGELRTQLSMIRTGTASLHGRTGANVGIAKDIEKKMDEGYMDPAQLRGALKGLKNWVDTYARKRGGATSATGGSESGGANIVRYDLNGKVIPKPPQ